MSALGPIFFVGALLQRPCLFVDEQQMPPKQVSFPGKRPRPEATEAPPAKADAAEAPEADAGPKKRGPPAAHQVFDPREQRSATGFPQEFASTKGRHMKGNCNKVEAYVAEFTSLKKLRSARLRHLKQP